jgi:hypothetical protein
LATLFADRLMAAHPAFWFPNRESPEGAMLGFAEALIVLSPYAAAADALSRAQLSQLDTTISQIRQGIGQAKFAPQAAANPPVRLTAIDYARLFDPGFVQLMVLDLDKAKSAWDSPPEKLIRDIRDAVNRSGDQLSAQARGQLEGQLVGSLSRLPPGKPVRQNGEGAARLLELLGQLFGTVEGSGAAPEEFWGQVVFPLAFTGTPTKFPELDDEEIAAAKKGVDLLAFWLDLIPHQVPAPEEGVLGAFEMEGASLPAPELGQAGPPRLIQVMPGKLKEAIEGFDVAQLRPTMERFAEQVSTQAGQKPQFAEDSAQMFDAACVLLGETKRLIAASKVGNQVLCVRHLTEAEAASESTWSIVRKALNGPRLILTSR